MNCVVTTRHHSPSIGPTSPSLPHASSVVAPAPLMTSSDSRLVPMRPSSVMTTEATISVIVT